MIRFFLIFAVGISMLCGCATSPANMSVINSGDADGSIERIFTITNRTPDTDPAIRFNGGRSDKVTYANVEVWIPKNRTKGKVKLPGKHIDPKTDFAVQSYQTIQSDSAFISQVNVRLNQLPKTEEKRIFLFVHGFNVPFGNGVYQQAQIGRDLDMKGAAVHFSWPSAGKVTQYMYDRDSVQFSRTALENTIDLLLQTDAKSITLLAHSMGALLTMETLRQISQKGKQASLAKINPLFLASPDIDSDVFSSQIQAISPLPKHFIIFVSRADRALKLSQWLRGGAQRVGSSDNIDQLLDHDIMVVDLTDLKKEGDKTRHSTFSSSPTIIRMVDEGILSRDSVENARVQTHDDTAVDDLLNLAKKLIYLPTRIGK